MALLPHEMEIILEFEPIVKLACSADCKHNLMYCAIEPEKRMPACNLKQITIGRHANCRNYEKVIPEDDTRG